MGNTIFLIILSLSLSGTVVGALLFLLKPLIRHRFSKRWQYYVWLVLLIRLIIPVTAEVNLIGSMIGWANEDRIQPRAVVNKDVIVENQADNDSADKDQKPALQADDKPAEKETGGTVPAESAAEAVKPEIPNVTEYAWAIWLFGAILVFALKIGEYRSFLRYVKAGNEAVLEEEIESCMDDVMMDLGIRKNIGLYRNKLMISPMFMGFHKPFIVLPKDLPSKEEIRYILTHELMHYKRKDLWYKWLFQLVSSLHWFNPFLLLVGREINQDCELACDEAVIRRLGEPDRAAYGNMLLHLADQGIRYRTKILSLTLVENKKNLKERLKSIMNYKKISKTALIGSFAAICFISVFAIAAGAKTEAGTDRAEKMAVAEEPMHAEEPDTTEIMAQAAGGQTWEEFPNIPVKLKDRGVNKSRESDITSQQAAKTYYDDKLIAGRDTAGVFNVSMTGKGTFGGDTIDFNRLIFSGAWTISVQYVNKPVKLEIEYTNEMVKGKFKLVHVNPENKVSVLSEGSYDGTVTAVLSEGRNAIKLVSDAGESKNLQIRLSQVEKNSLLVKFNAEGDEESTRLLQEVIEGGSVNLDRLLENAENMNSEDVSNCIVSLLKTNKTIQDSQWTMLLDDVDEDILGSYLLSQLKAGKAVNMQIMNELAKYMQEESVSEYVIYIMDHDIEISDKELKELSMYADEKRMKTYVFDLLKSGKRLDSTKMNLIAYAMDEEAISEYVIYLLEHNIPTEKEELTNLCYFADEKRLGEYVQKRLDSGKSFSSAQFSQLAPALSEKMIAKYVISGLRDGLAVSEDMVQLAYLSDEAALGEGVIALAKTQKGLSYEKVEKIIYALDEEDVISYLKTMIPKQKEGALAFMKTALYHVEEEDMADCLIYAINKGVKVNVHDLTAFTQLSEEELGKCIDLMKEKKLITPAEAKKYRESYLD